MGDALCPESSQGAVSPLLRINKENLAHFLGNKSEQALEFTPVRKIILVIFAPYLRGHDLRRGGAGLVDGGDPTVFLASAIIIGLIARMSEEELTSTFINGARFAGRCTDYRYRARYRSDHG